jgi:Mce-associated membrane protein
MSAKRPLAGATALRAVLVVLIIALVAVTGVLRWQNQKLENHPALANRAMLDELAQEEVEVSVARSLSQVLSYDWQAPEATRAIADQVLSGQAREEYDTLFASLEERAPDQKLVLTAAVQVVGVQELSREKAQLLVFLDQSSTRAKDNEASVSAAQLKIIAERRDKFWVVIGLTPL